MLLRMIAAMLALSVGSGCVAISPSDRNDPAVILGLLLASKTPKTEIRSLYGKNVMFSNTGALFYPEELSRHIVTLIAFRETKGAWPPIYDRLLVGDLGCDQAFESPYLRISVTDPKGETYQVLLDKDLMVSVLPDKEAVAELLVATIHSSSRKP